MLGWSPHRGSRPPIHAWVATSPRIPAAHPCLGGHLTADPGLPIHNEGPTSPTGQGCGESLCREVFVSSSVAEFTLHQRRCVGSCPQPPAASVPTIYDGFVGLKVIALAFVFAGCGGRLGGESEAGPAAIPAACVLEASSYDPSCTVDSDCVSVAMNFPISFGNICDSTRCFCGGETINKDALAQYSADFQRAFSLRPSTGSEGGCSCGTFGQSCCQNGRCAVSCPIAPPSDASAFVGPWLCGSIGATPGPLTITASGDELTETDSQTVPDGIADASVTITCTSVYTAAGTHATLNPGSLVCTGAANIQVPQPSSDTITVNGNTMTFVVSYPGEATATSICTKQ